MAVRLLGVDELDGAQVLDVRQGSEFAGGHLHGARNVELGEVPTSADDLIPGPIVVMCGHGERAMTGASLLERAGHLDVSVLVGGPEDWAREHGAALETGA